MNWTLGMLLGVRTSAQQWTTFKNILRDGPVSETPNPPALPELGTVPALPPGIVPRLLDLVNRIKAAPKYTEAIGEDPGIVGPETLSDILSVKPILTIRFVAGHPEIVWKKQGLTSLEIQVDRGTGWTFLPMDTVPNYLDTAPIPPTPAVWRYKAVYRLNDNAVGQWSDIATITVGA